MRKHAEKRNGLHDLLEIMLESLLASYSCDGSEIGGWQA